ncbi:hypothetical protein DSM104299_03309 [Baekduia alba]|uniref:hypothetical protein n=1 Tax=Baekduia alba TaxID=2997333 RepID=UPI0023425375|nr:hypothetical protein [Baekduia alba]WCB94572.1 hypothetical protein DSM104299_03309 [Baekduia alba]
MNTIMIVNTQVKPEHVGDVDAAAATLFAAIDRAQPQGIKYASLRLADGVTYLALLQIAEGVENPLPQLPEFGAFQQGLREWVAGPPAPGQATVVGSYGLF